MMIQQDVEGSKIKATLNQDNALDTIATSIKYWPSVLYLVQRMTNHGAYFEAVPPVKLSGSESAKIHLSILKKYYHTGTIENTNRVDGNRD
eukprot:13335041-Ditylum_brightwellii.AAC.1